MLHEKLPLQRIKNLLEEKVQLESRSRSKARHCPLGDSDAGMNRDEALHAQDFSEPNGQVPSQVTLFKLRGTSWVGPN